MLSYALNQIFNISVPLVLMAAILAGAAMEMIRNHE